MFQPALGLTRRRLRLLSCLIAFVLVLASSFSAAPVSAQGTLPNRYTSEDGSLSFRYPKGWRVDENSSSIDLATTVNSLNANNPDVQVPDGEVLIQFAQPGTLNDMGVPPSATPEEAVRATLSFVSATGSILPFEGGPAGAVISVFEGGAWGGSAMLIAVPYPDRLLLVAVRPGGPVSEFEGLVRDIVNSVEVSAGAAALPTVGPDGLLHQFASGATGSSQYGETSWNFAQATGAPDTPDCGDIPTAWASAIATGQDSLTLTFDVPVIVTQLNIYQTYNPGAIVGIEIGSLFGGQSVLVPNSADPPGNTPCPGVFTLNLQDVPFAVNVVVIYLDQTITGIWNEIDAVELVGVPVEALPEPVSTAEALPEPVSTAEATAPVPTPSN